MGRSLNGAGVRDGILKQGQKATEATAYFWGNVTQGVQDSTKGALTLDSGKRGATGIYKAGKDFARGDVVCGTLCSLSTGCETLCAVVICCPIPGKVPVVAGLKAVSIGCQRFRDLCAADPSSPFCD